MIHGTVQVPPPNSPLAKEVQPYWMSPDEDGVIYQGDALEILERLPDESFDCVWTDPPYHLSNDGITCVAGKMVPVNKGDWDRSRGIEGDLQFNLAWTAQCFRILKPTGSIWVTGTLHVHASVGMALLKNGFRILNDIVWLKPNPPPNLGRRTFTHSTEVVYWASKAQQGTAPGHKFNYEAMKEENGGKQMKSVWQFGVPRKGTTETKFGRHPTQKPIALVDRCIRASTDIGDSVLDPFVGSGTTGVAALTIGRSFAGIENKPEFLDMAVSRMKEIRSTPPLRKFQKSCFSHCWFGRYRYKRYCSNRRVFLRLNWEVAWKDSRRSNYFKISKARISGRWRNSWRSRCFRLTRESSTKDGLAKLSSATSVCLLTRAEAQIWGHGS